MSKKSIVSIPHRLATNDVRASVEEVKKLVFQFLIGWLQTKGGIISEEVLNAVFQFLIGWLQTRHSLVYKRK